MKKRMTTDTALPDAIHDDRLRVVLAYPHAIALCNGDHPWRALGRFLQSVLVRRKN